MNSPTALLALSQVINHDTHPQIIRAAELARVSASQVRIIKKYKKAKFKALRKIYTDKAGWSLEMIYVETGLITLREYANILHKRITDRQRLNELLGYLGYTNPNGDTPARTLRRARDVIEGRLGPLPWFEEAEQLAKKLDMSLIDIYNWGMSNDPEWADRTKQEQYEMCRNTYQHYITLGQRHIRPWGWFRESD